MESGGFEGLGTACTPMALPTGMGSKSIYTNYLGVCIHQPINWGGAQKGKTPFFLIYLRASEVNVELELLQRGNLEDLSYVNIMIARKAPPLLNH